MKDNFLLHEKPPQHSINQENQRESVRLYEDGKKALDEKDYDSAYKFFQQSVDFGNIDAIYIFINSITTIKSSPH